jgi:hypothetical protein
MMLLLAVESVCGTLKNSLIPTAGKLYIRLNLKILAITGRYDLYHDAHIQTAIFQYLQGTLESCRYWPLGDANEHSRLYT